MEGSPPSVLMPLTVEPCLAYVRTSATCPHPTVLIRSLLEKKHFQTKLDDKSGYDHVLMDVESRLLGLCCDSTLAAFSLSSDKLQKFAEFREQILSERSVSLVSIQKIIGKCISFSLVVPAAKLFSREMNLAVSRALLKSKKFVKITGPLRKELEYWRFLDTWEGHMTWHEEGHVSLSLASDASGSGWVEVLLNSDGQVVREVGDSWCETMQSFAIHVRETVALYGTLRSLGDVVRNRRVDVLVDSSVLYGCWERQYASSHFMLEALKNLFWTTVDLNVAIP